jgi:hypothetical protein
MFKLDLSRKLGLTRQRLPGRQECVTGYVPTHYVLMLVSPYQMVMWQSNPWDCPYEISNLWIFGLAFRARYLIVERVN